MDREPPATISMCRHRERMAALAAHVLSGRVTTSHATVTSCTASADPGTRTASQQQPSRRLLSDEDMAKFLSTGFLSLPLGPPGDSLHHRVHRRAEELEALGQMDAFNIYPRIVELEPAVLRHPVICGALRSILGESYAMSAHRSLRFATGKGQTTHKDTQRWPVLTHRPRTVYIFYLPAGCTLQMGPTAIIPQSSWLSRDRADWSSVVTSATNLAPSLSEHLCTAPAHQGEAVLLHSSIFHRGTAATSLSLQLVESNGRTSELPRRAMIKLIFHRTQAPSGEPTWDHDPDFDWAAAAARYCVSS